MDLYVNYVVNSFNKQHANLFQSFETTSQMILKRRSFPADCLLGCRTSEMFLHVHTKSAPDFCRWLQADLCFQFMLVTVGYCWFGSGKVFSNCPPGLPQMGGLEVQLGASEWRMSFCSCSGRQTAPAVPCKNGGAARRTTHCMEICKSSLVPCNLRHLHVSILEWWKSIIFWDGTTIVDPAELLEKAMDREGERGRERERQI